MTKPMPWIKQSTNIINDVSLMSLHERQQLRYFQLYLLAGYLNAGGAFIQNGKQLTHKEIAAILRIRDASLLAKDMNTMKKAGLIKANGHGPYIASFAEEQGDYIKKLAEHRDRQKRYMSTKKNDASVMVQGDVSAVSVTPLEREEESEAELKDSSLLLSGAAQKFSKANITLKDGERIALSEIIAEIKPAWLDEAIRVAVKNKKHSGAYVIGILKNWRSANGKDRSSSKQSSGTTKQPTVKQSTTSAATSAAAKLIIARRQKTNV